MLKIGLTGGIGSGKSTVAKIFEVLGIPVYYADIEANRIMHEDETIIQKIIDAFGEKSYLNQKLNKPFISSIIFKDSRKKEILNDIVHPATIIDSLNWSAKQQSPYIIKEAALIFESASEKNLDYIIGVRAPLALRINRIISRDNITEEQVLARMASQMNEDEKMNKCDFVINNNEIELVIPQVIALHEHLLAK